jgi:hypothetical protein
VSSKDKSETEQMSDSTQDGSLRFKEDWKQNRSSTGSRVEKDGNLANGWASKKPVFRDAPLGKLLLLKH